MGQDFWEIISVFLMSTVKLVWGAVPMGLGFGFSVVKTIFVTCAGSFTGVLVFVFMSDYIVRYYKRKAEERRLKKVVAKQVKIFTRKNKTIVKIKKKFGLLGIAILTPVLFSIPLGCFLAIRYFKQKQKVIAYMFGSVIFWSFSTSLLLDPLINAIRTYFL